MKHPKLKHALLCRILTYVVVIGGFFLPFLVACCLDFVPEGVKAALFLATLLALVVYIFRNALVLTVMDMFLATLRCWQMARSRYCLPEKGSPECVEVRIARFGKKCSPSALEPRPTDLRYRFRSSALVYARGIEEVVALFSVDTLEADTFHAVVRSAKANSKALTGTKQPRFLDSAQKKAPLNRVTVIVILAKRVDSALEERLYKTVCGHSGDAFENAFVPCVVNLENRSCVFDSLRVPYTGFARAVKNRGIRLVKRLVFGGKIPLTGNRNYLEPIRDMDPEQTLWDFWKALRCEYVLRDRENRKRFEAMKDRQIRREKDILFLKWEKNGLSLPLEWDPEKKTAKTRAISQWTYPKARPIAGRTIREIEGFLAEDFSRQGYHLEFEDAGETRKRSR